MTVQITKLSDVGYRDQRENDSMTAMTAYSSKGKQKERVIGGGISYS